MSSIFPVARFGPMAWVWTLGFCAAALYFGWRTLDSISSGRLPDNYDLGVAALLFAYIFYGGLRSIRRYRIAGDNLLIERWAFGRISIPLESIRTVQALPRPVSFFNVGILSTGGLFGWAGKAQLRMAGDKRALNAEVYGTNPAKVVIVGLNNEQTYVLTPADPVGLVDAVQAASAQERPEEGYASRARRGKKGKTGRTG